MECGDFMGFVIYGSGKMSISTSRDPVLRDTCQGVKAPSAIPPDFDEITVNEQKA